MKNKSGEELKDIKYTLLNELRSELSSFRYEIDYSSISRYDIFFELYNELKQKGDYSEEDIEKIFKYNVELLSIYNKEPKELFSGKYNAFEIKYILGKNIKYNIDYILNGDLKVYSLNRLRELEFYSEKLDDYYPGLGNFVKLLWKIEITDQMIPEINLLNPFNFYTISKYLGEKYKNSLESKEHELENELNQNKRELEQLKKEQMEKEEIENKYVFYSTILMNKCYADILKKDYNELCKQILQNQDEYKRIIKEHQITLTKIEEYIAQKGSLKDFSYKDTEEFSNLQLEIDKIEHVITGLKKYPLFQLFKIMKNKKNMKSLKYEQQEKERLFNEEKEQKKKEIDIKINKLKEKIDYLKEQMNLKIKINIDFEEQMKVLNEKLSKYFCSSSILEMENLLKQAEQYIKNYDYNNNVMLEIIQMKIDSLEEKIIVQESDYVSIQTEKTDIEAMK